jgi:UDP-glucose 4-epimerase
MKVFITGGAGFIGSHLMDRVLKLEQEVIIYDNLSTGRKEFIEDNLKNRNLKFIEGDSLNAEVLTQVMRGCEIVFHLAANADVRYGTQQPNKDLEQNTLATFNVLEAMRINGIKKIVFASTGSIYGEPEIFPTPEDALFPIQTSLYGASKLAAEGLIEAYCEGFDMQAWIFRFVSVLGERYSHGHVFDFYKSLKKNPHTLHVLGDGHQKKSYMYVQDCIDAILMTIERAKEKVNIFNLGTDEYCEVNDSVRWITEYLGVSPKLTYAGGVRGWIGDSPFIFLDCRKIRQLGWTPKLSIREAVIRTLRYLMENPWLLEKRS